MGGATVGQWGQLAPTEIRLWGQNYVIAPIEIRRARSERYKKEILPPLAKSRGAAHGTYLPMSDIRCTLVQLRIHVGIRIRCNWTDSAQAHR